MNAASLTPNKVLRGPIFPVVKVEHHCLRQDSIKHPLDLKEDSAEYRTGGDS